MSLIRPRVPPHGVLFRRRPEPLEFPQLQRAERRRVRCAGKLQRGSNDRILESNCSHVSERRPLYSVRIRPVQE